MSSAQLALKVSHLEADVKLLRHRKEELEHENEAAKPLEIDSSREPLRSHSIYLYCRIELNQVIHISINIYN